MSVKTYDPSEILMSFLTSPIVGFADGTFVKVERDEAAFTKMTGADGEVARSRNKNKGGKITFTLAQWSPSNDILSAAALVDELSGTGVGPAFVKDNQGTTLALAANAWVEKMATAEFGKEQGNREWVIDCASIEFFVGGIS